MEAERLRALHDLRILDTPPDTEFESIVQAASLVCGTPISALSLVDENRQWFKASVGMAGKAGTSRAVAFCDHTIRGDGVLEIADTITHPDFASNPLVTDAPFFRFYAGVPLCLASGHKVGTLCVIDREPRVLDDRQRQILCALAQTASIALDNFRARQVANRQRLELYRSEEFLDRTGRIAGVGGWELDIVTGEILWSAETCRIHGVASGYRPTLDQAIGFYATQAQPIIRAAVAAALAEGSGWDLELPFIRADGEPLWVRAVGEVSFHDGVASRISGAFQDITRKIAARAALRESSERETALFNNSPDILYLVAISHVDGLPQFVFESINPAVTRATGWAVDQIIGCRTAEWLPADAATHVEAQFRRCLAQDATCKFQMTCATSFGVREFEGSVTPIRDGQTGTVVRVLGVLRDVTDAVRMQAELHHRQKLDTVGRLAAGVAHDFNNILQGISGSLELLLDEVAPNSVAHEMAGVGLRSARRGSYLTHHLLSYARKQILSPRMIALPALLVDLQSLLARTLGAHIGVCLRCDPAIPELHLDPGQLQTALLNLAINAGDAMPQSGTLTIEAGARSQGDVPWVTIAVTDTGSGMDAATLAQATDPFFTTKGLNGTGLGLSMVQGFAEQSGGMLRIASRVGEGTRIELDLPGARQGSVLGLPAPVVRAPHGAGTILVVDDDPDVLAMVAAFLSSAGFAVLRASSGQHALDRLAEAAPIAALVTDYAMPGLNGVELIARARATHPHLPAVLISGFVELSEAPLWEPATLMLQKPFKRDDLTAALVSVLANSQQTGADVDGQRHDDGVEQKTQQSVQCRKPAEFA